MISGFLCPTSSITVEFKVALVVIRQGPIGVREEGSGGSGDPPVGLETSGSLEAS